MQVNRKIHLCLQNAPIYKLSHSKAPKILQIEHWQRLRKKTVKFQSVPNQGATLASTQTLLI